MQSVFNGGSMKKKLVIAVCSLLILLSIVFCAFVFSLPKAKESITLEVGSEKPSAIDFLEKDYEDKFNLVKIESGVDVIDMSVLGDYPVTVKVFFMEYETVLHVVDTVAPEVMVYSDEYVHFAGDEKPDISAFIESISDLTETTIAYVDEPNFTEVGTQDVYIDVTDEGGNVTTVICNLVVWDDTIPPVIEGAKDIYVTVGGSVSYKKGVTATDDIDTDVDLKIDAAGVTLSEVGEYPVVYTATDDAGNQTVVEIIVHVVAEELPTEDKINAAADKILSQIINDSMSEYDKAYAIFRWVHDKIAYSDNTPKNGYVDGAYRGLVKKQGDCYTYAMSAKCLLTRAGIKNMDIAKIPAKTNHYWNLIDLGDGWYHFDATRRRDKSEFFYVNDETLMEYSRNHSGTHNYDVSAYPTIQ